MSLNVEPRYLSLGFTHTAVLTRSGELFTAGARTDGQLGTAEESNSLEEGSGVPITRIVQFGFENKAIKVACGDNYTLVLNEKGEVYSFGKAANGRLGLGRPEMEDEK